MSHLPKNHPVRFLIESAANGRKLTEKDLDLLNNADLPTGESLTTYKADVVSAARRVAQAGAGGNRQEALTLAEGEWAGLATRMSPAQLAVKDSSSPEDDQKIRDMVSNIFNN